LNEPRVTEKADLRAHTEKTLSLTIILSSTVVGDKKAWLASRSPPNFANGTV